MESEQQSDRETYRLIFFGPDRSYVLLAGEEGGFQLPCVEIPRWQRVAEHLTAVTRNKYGCVAISLFGSEINALRHNSNGPYYQAMECVCSGKEHASNTAWRSVSSLTPDSFKEEADYQALRHCATESTSYEADSASPFARCGWFNELRRWVTEAIESIGLHLTGAFHQFNASPSFSLIRFETDGLAVWFKAVGEPNLREFQITLELAELFPRYMPEIVATQPDWSGWLSLEAQGAVLDGTDEITEWTAAAAALAKLQMDSLGKTGAIADAGAHIGRMAVLEALIDPFLDVIALLMKQQAKSPPAILSRENLTLLGRRIHDSLGLLDEFGIPDALGHLDLNPGNVIVSAERCVFLDWAEAYVGHPFFSFEYLLEHFRCERGRDASLESRLVASYCAPWEQLVPASVVTEARQFTPLLAAFAYATGTGMWRDQERLQDPLAAGYLRSLVRRMNREASQLVDRRLRCLS